MDERSDEGTAADTANFAVAAAAVASFWNQVSLLYLAFILFGVNLHVM